MKFVLMSSLLAAVLAAPAFADDYPTQDIQGVIQFAAGGGTDIYSRSIQPHAEKALGRSIIMTNRTGANGVIGMQYVFGQPADGYTLLFGAETPQTYRVLDMADKDYMDMAPINVSAYGVSVIAVNADSPITSMQELLDAAKANPGKLKMGYLGPGSPGHVVQAMIKTAAEFAVTPVPYDGDGTSMPALMGGAVDFIPAGLGATFDLIKSGRLRALAVINDQPIPQLPEVPAITEALPELKKFLPWGSFYGVYVRQEVPEDAKATLVQAFAKATQEPEFRELMERRGNIVLSLSGQEASDFLTRWRATTAWLLFDTGAATKSPEALGIVRP